MGGIMGIWTDEGASASRSRWTAVTITLGLVALSASFTIPASAASAAPDASAVTATVTNCNDSGPGTLRQAVLDATSHEVVTFTTAPSCHTITLASTIDIAHDLTIEGPGAGTMAVSGNDAVGVFHIESGVTVAISDLTIEKGSAQNGGGIFNDGRLTVSESSLSDNLAATGGGAIWSNGPVAVTDSTLAGNSADYYGGAIYSASDGTLSVTGSTLSDNSATSSEINYPGYAYGGGIAAYGKATVAGTTLAGNRAASFGGGSGGGGIYVGGTMNVTDTTVSGNTNSIVAGANDGDGGAGIENVGTLTVTDSTVADNTTNADGGGLDNGGTATFSDSTIAANAAATGGGISNDGRLTITADTVSGNSAHAGGGGGIDDVSGATAVVTAAIVAGNASGDDCAGSVTDGGYDLDDDGTCGFAAVTDHSDVPAGLDPAGLEDSGGATEVIALDPGSVAIGAVTSSSLCSTPDQQGVPRPTPCDIGAVDLVLIPQAITFTSVPPTGAVVGGASYAVSATGGASGAPVVFSIDASASSVCSITAATVSFFGVGTCVVDANQAGDTLYDPAPQDQQTFTVGPAPLAITSAGDAVASAGAPFAFTVTTSGTPVPAIKAKRLPTALVLTDNGNGTADISGTPSKPGTFHFTIKAVFGVGKTRQIESQAFTLTVKSDVPALSDSVQR
jgi:predicted outer membrane repeat protein